MSSTKYPPEEIEKIQEQIIRAIGFGLSPQQSAEVAGIHFHTLDKWMRENPQFKEKIHSIKSKQLEILSSKMYQLAAQGDFRALSYLLSNASNSPFRSDRINLTDEEIDAMEKIANFLMEQGGLIPTSELPIIPLIHKLPKK